MPHRNQSSGRLAAGAFVAITPTLLLAVLCLTGCGDATSTKEPAGSSATPRSSGQTFEATAELSSPASPADQAWAAYQSMFSNPPVPPESWSNQPPDEAAFRAFQRSRGESAAKVADAANDFSTRFANDPRASSAHWQELQLLNLAVQLGHTNVAARLEALEKARLADPATSEDERLGIQMAAAQRTAELLLPQGEEAARAALEQSARELAKQFPQRPEPYQLLLNLASAGDPEKARATASSLLNTNVPEVIRASAELFLKKLDLVGKAIDLKFTALDGREIDIAQLRGKVVLLDFWATWCGPCIAELPNVKAAYERLHPQGFEILGISFDEKKDVLAQFLGREAMSWPQYFDGKGWQNALGQRFGIESIPSMWLIDKQGVVRDLEGRTDLETKVARLLAETAAEARP